MPPRRLTGTGYRRERWLNACGVQERARRIFTSTGVGTPIAQGKRTEVINGREFLFRKTPLHAEFALVQADAADRWGNLTYRKTARNFGPRMHRGYHHDRAGCPHRPS